MRGFSFHIDPSATFRNRGRLRTRSAFDFGFLFRLPRFFSRARPAVIVKPAAHTPRPDKFFHSEPAILTARQIPYGNFQITTSQLRDGTWIASYGCADGRLFCVDGTNQAVLVTQACPSEPLALTEALLQIDSFAPGL